jgi:hypothetical protein
MFLVPVIYVLGPLHIPIARNRIRFFEIAIRFRQIAVKHHRPENRPLRLDRWVSTQNL